MEPEDEEEGKDVEEPLREGREIEDVLLGKEGVSKLRKSAGCSSFEESTISMKSALRK